METERKSLSLTDIARSLYPGSQFSLEETETMSDKYDSALEVLLERQHQLTTKLRDASLQITHLRQHCLQLKNTLAEAKKGNRSVLDHDHSLFIANDDANGDSNGTNQYFGIAQNSIPLNGSNKREITSDSDMNDKQTDDESMAPPSKGITYQSQTQDIIKEHESAEMEPKKVETRGRKKKIETRGRKRKIIGPVLPKDRPKLSTSASQVMESLTPPKPTVVRKKIELFPNIPSQEQSSTSVIRGATSGPYSFRTITKKVVPYFYANSELVDELLEPVDFIEKVAKKDKKNKKEDANYRGYTGSSSSATTTITHTHKRKRLDIGNKEPTFGFTIKRKSAEDLVDDDDDDDDYDDDEMQNRSRMAKTVGCNQDSKEKIKVRGSRISGGRINAREKKALKFLRENPHALDNPKYPLRIGPKATLVNPGEIYPDTLFYSDCVIFPVGYEIIREFRSTLTPNAFANYTCKISKEGDHPVFHVLPHDNPGVEITSLSPSGCWSEVLKRANNLIPTEHRANTASGIEYFNLGHPIPKLLIELLPDAEKCIGYKFIHPAKRHLNEN